MMSPTNKLLLLLMAVHLFMESQGWMLKFVTQTSSALPDSQKDAILGQIECATGVLKLVRQHLESLVQDPSPDCPEA